MVCGIVQVFGDEIPALLRRTKGVSFLSDVGKMPVDDDIAAIAAGHFKIHFGPEPSYLRFQLFLESVRKIACHGMHIVDGPRVSPFPVAEGVLLRDDLCRAIRNHILRGNRGIRLQDVAICVILHIGLIIT